MNQQQREFNEAVREVRLIEKNAAGKVKAYVEKILDLELYQIEAYLDRPEPKIEDALFHVKRIREEILDKWEQERKSS